ncbi:DUF3320 domain-containing protein [Mycobacterium asiaticum]|uniref:DUF3320 domain-containing protein n=1 Tax=Mycobacterium asiaticum TaxID=1790 RepID=UPI000687A0F4|nr:DUF3320 domain-containing protein [Mycobacterium asiaticum]ORA16381.1 hypothetical protein BST16_06660 [Mycobacterium asiaticum DSM 44297]
MDNRASVQAALDYLASRLDQYIAAVLAPELGGLPWTTVLSELDRAKGHLPKNYSTGDLQAQLRILTERLGGLGYPFSDPTRTLSVLGGELRIVRNRWAHNDEFTALDAWRTHDFVVRLLSHIGDQEGRAEAERMRSASLGRVVEESHLFVPDRVPTPAHVSEAQEVTPEAAVLERADTAATPVIGDSRFQFEPWTVVHVGDSAVLDELPNKRAKEEVRAVATDIVEYEGPIQLDRLARLIAQSFGVTRLHHARSKRIVQQIKGLGYDIDNDKFVWPPTIDRSTWTEFRPNPSSTDRPFEEVSPVEIANAARLLLREGPLDLENLEDRMLRTFGRSRRTKAIKAHLKKALDYARSAGIVAKDDGSRVASGH